MNVSFDLAYLADSDDAGVASIESTVWTVTPASLAEEAPEVHRFLSQYVIDIEDQNDWVHEYSYEERAADDVAQEWISNNLDTVAQWLDGVKTRDGELAIDQVRAQFGS